MKIHEIIETSKKLREAARMRKIEMSNLRAKLPVDRSLTLSEAEFIDFIHRVLADGRLVAALTELAKGGVEIIIGDRDPQRENILVEGDGIVFIHHEIKLENISSFLELPPTKASA
jgi:hypothetical protein